MEISEVIDAPDHEEAARLLASAPETPAATVPEPAHDPAPTPAKRKSGWPKGKKRGRRAQPVQREYQPAESTPDAPTEPVSQAQDEAAVRGAPDPELVAFVRGPLKAAVLTLTKLAARMAKRPDLVASEDEADMIADAGAVVIALRMPKAGAASPELMLLLALGVYALPRLDMGDAALAAGALNGAPVAVVE